MNVYYSRGEYWNRLPERLKQEEDMLALSYNNWDDFGVHTTLNAVLFLNGENFLTFSLKLLIEGEKDSPKKLNEFCEGGWDGFFPIPDINYVSVPSDINFYSALLGSVGEDEARELLENIRDAGYMSNVLNDPEAIRIIEYDDFDTSPLREAGARKAFSDGWALFVHKDSKIEDFVLYARKYDGSAEAVSFKFNSENLPYDINILIGPNGVGKSYTLKSLVEYWLGIKSGNKELLKEQDHRPFDRFPNISKLILISYSPFEEFAMDLSEAKLLDRDAYTYFGFRQAQVTDDGDMKIRISRNLPASDSAGSILKALADDCKFGFMPNWTMKFDAIWSVLQPAIGFDHLALEVTPDLKIPFGAHDVPELIEGPSGEKFLPLSEQLYGTIQDWGINLNESVKKQSGVIFILDGKKVDLSSGQRLFCYIVVNVVGQIRSDSLVVIDEPELFLHPTLEIEFIGLLKKVLVAFNSKAILATHSLTIAREVPANCIHVYRQHDGEMDVDAPPFETFGGDMQRISSYVFGDNSISKPFDEWIENKLDEIGNPQTLIDQLGNEINEETLIKILNSGGRDGG